MKTLISKMPQWVIGAMMLASAPTFADQVVSDDYIVVGSLCVGFDCVNGESFGFDTLRLKENNLRIKMIDTSSSSSFPTRDWQLTINDSANGGVNWFGLEDLDAGTTPLTILASAPNNSLYISSNGNVGFGTITPLVDVNIKAGNTPTLRLEQDTSSGFAEQTWDLGGNEANFFIRDVSNGSALPFKIMPSAPNGSLHIAADGDIGFETTTPDGQFDVAHSTDANDHAFLISPVSYVGINIDNGQLPNGLFDIQTTGGGSLFMVQSDGDVGIGAATPASVLHVARQATKDSFLINTPTTANSNHFLINKDGQVGIGLDTFSSAYGTPSSLEVFGTSTSLLTFGISTNAGHASLAFRGNSTDKWLISSRNESDPAYAAQPDRLTFFNKDTHEVLTIHQNGRLFIGIDDDFVNTAGHPIEVAITGVANAYLSVAGVWTNASSREVKKDIIGISSETAKSALDILNPVTYEYLAQPGETYAGFIAEDVPDIVATPDRKTLASMDIVAVLTKVVKDQQQTIEKLVGRLDKLEAANKD